MINRITRDETSWVEHVTGWLPGPDTDELLAKLTANAAWEQHERRVHAQGGESREIRKRQLPAEVPSVTGASQSI